MSFLSLFVLLLNIACLVFLSLQMRQIKATEERCRQIETNIGEMVRENSRIVDVIVDELEKKLSESHEVIRYFEENTFAAPHSTEVLPFRTKLQKKAKMTGLEEMWSHGLSHREIAENLRITQGEVALKLNMRKYLCKKQLL